MKTDENSDQPESYTLHPEDSDQASPPAAATAPEAEVSLEAPLPDTPPASPDPAPRKARREKPPRQPGATAKAAASSGQIEIDPLSASSLEWIRQDFSTLDLGTLDARTAIEGAWRKHGQTFIAAWLEVLATGESPNYRDYISRRQRFEKDCLPAITPPDKNTDKLRFRLSPDVAESLLTATAAVNAATSGARYHARDLLGMVFRAYGVPHSRDIIHHQQQFRAASQS